MKEIFTRLRDSSSLASSTLHLKHYMSLHNEAYLVEGRVVNLIKAFSTEDPKAPTVKLVYGKSWLLGCRLYLYTVLRNHDKVRPVRCDVLQGMITELRECLEEEFQGYGEIYGEFEKDGVINPHYKRYYSPNVLLYVFFFSLPASFFPCPLYPFLTLFLFKLKNLTSFHYRRNFFH